MMTTKEWVLSSIHSEAITDLLYLLCHFPLQLQQQRSSLEQWQSILAARQTSRSIRIRRWQSYRLSIRLQYALACPSSITIIIMVIAIVVAGSKTVAEISKTVHQSMDSVIQGISIPMLCNYKICFSSLSL